MIYTKPTGAVVEYKVNKWGEVLTLAGAAVEEYKAAQIAGQWAVMEAAWENQGSGAAIVEKIFIERLSWAAEDGRVKVSN